MLTDKTNNEAGKWEAPSSIIMYPFVIGHFSYYPLDIMSATITWYKNISIHISFLRLLEIFYPFTIAMYVKPFKHFIKRGIFKQIWDKFSIIYYVCSCLHL